MAAAAVVVFSKKRTISILHGGQEAPITALQHCSLIIIIIIITGITISIIIITIAIGVYRVLARHIADRFNFSALRIRECNCQMCRLQIVDC